MPEGYLPYRQRIDVIWDGAVYGADYGDVMDGVTKFNKRSWTSATQQDFARVQARIMEGDVIVRVKDEPVLPWSR